MKLTYNNCKHLRDLSPHDWRDIAGDLADNTVDFEYDDYRFIHRNHIDRIQQEELAGDKYTLGAFHAWFLADILDVPTAVIERMQDAGGYSALGAWIVQADKLAELQQAYASADGYGHHFAHYDFEEHELGDYYYFRTN